MTEQPGFTEEQRQYIKQRIDQRVAEEVVPRVDKAFDVGGVSVLRSLALMFGEEERNTFSKAEIIIMLGKFEREINPDGTVTRLVDELEGAGW